MSLLQRTAKMRWTSSGFKESGSSEKCPATTGNRAGREGSDRKGEDASWDGFFVLDPDIKDNMLDSQITW